MKRRNGNMLRRLGWTGMLVGLFMLVTACQGSQHTESTAGAPANTAEMPGEQLARLQALDETSERLYTAAEAGKPEDAIKYLESMSIQMTQASFDGATNLEGLEAMAAAVLEAKKAFVATKPDRRQWLLKATAVRLAADALTHKHQPMWHKFDDLMAEDLDQLLVSAEKRESTTIKESLVRFEEHYQTVRPAMSISLEPQLVTEADSMFAYLRGRINKDVPEFAAVTQQKEAFRVLLGKLFAKHQEERTAYAPVQTTHPWTYWTAGIGSIIFTVLAFVGYKIFQYDRHHVRTPRRRERG